MLEYYVVKIVWNDVRETTKLPFGSLSNAIAFKTNKLRDKRVDRIHIETVKGNIRDKIVGGIS